MEDKEIFFGLLKNNPIFRDNLNILSQMSLRYFPQQIMPEILNRVADMCKWELTPPLESSAYLGCG